MATSLTKPTYIHWDFSSDKAERVRRKAAKPAPVWKLLEAITHSVVINYTDIKIPGVGVMKDYFVTVLHPCCTKKVREYKDLGFKTSRSYPMLLLEYTMTEADVLHFKSICTDKYNLVHTYPGKAYEHKFGASFKESFKLDKAKIMDWHRKESEWNDAEMKREMKAQKKREEKGLE